MSGNPKVAKIIINHFNHLYFNHTNQQNKTGLYYLIGKETSKIIDIINILLDNGLDINFTPKNGNSILTEFVFDVKPDLKVINFLLKNGADWNTMTTQNKTLYERIKESVENSFFYVQSQSQIKSKILEFFEYYKKIEERRKIEEEKEKENENKESNETKESELK